MQSPIHQPSVLHEYGVAVLLTIGIFVLDLLTPSGVVEWLLYAVPLALTLRSSRAYAPLYYTGVVTLLLAIGFAASPSGVPTLYAVVNRLLGVGLMWAFALALTGRQLIRTEAQANRERMTQALTAAQAELTEAETARVAAVEARVHAEAAVLGAVAGQRRAEEEMLGDKVRLEGIVQSAMDAIITVDEQQRIVLFNHAAERMFAWTAADLLGRPLERLLPERFHAAHAERIKAFGRSGITSRQMGSLGTITGVRAGGEEFPIEAAISQIEVEGTRYYTVILRDITERKRLETELAEREALLRAIIETEPECVTVLALDGTVRTMNAAGLAMVEAGSSREIVGTDFCKVVASEFQPAFRELICKAGQGEAERLDFEMTGLLGAHRSVETHMVPLRGAEGAITAVLGVTRDVTERKEAEQRLRQSEERLQSLLGAMEDVIWSSSLDLSRIYYVSPSVSAIYARPAEDFVTRPALWLEVVHPDDRPLAEQALRELLTTGEFDVEYRIVRLDGDLRWLHDRRRVIEDKEGRPLRIDGIVSDITERKRLQAQLRRTERVAELGTVASGMAHEIGTPMNVILGRAEYLMERTKEEPVRKGLQTIVTQVERITRVMNQLLAFARRRPVDYRALDLRQTIEGNLEIFQERLAHNGITVETAFADACPSVHADADQMSQVLINLIMNAIHAMPTGGTLRLALAPDRGMVKLTVADTGQGMPRDVIAKIFDPFFTTKEFGKGTGLGLTVVKGLIEEHNGTIMVESEPEKGTVFTLCLPIDHADGT